MSAAPKLYYFDGRGKGEIIRLALAAAGIEFTEELMTERSQMVALIEGNKLMFNQLPMLEIDGRQITQSNAIVRYIARKAGLFGKNEDETVLVDQTYEGGRDFTTPSLPLFFKPVEEVLKSLKADTIPKYMPFFERIAAKTGSGYLVGSSLTIADVSVLEGLLIYVEYFGKDILSGYPAVQKFYDTVTSEPKIDAYLKGLQRKRKNDARYISDVRTVLAWENKI